ncbi:MAG: hypothetical protein LBK69_05095 [Syntrophomonadaceae bacterium]|nr:hypothetical protein [Syntrophomonadaceae bacterium]
MGLKREIIKKRRRGYFQWNLCLALIALMFAPMLLVPGVFATEEKPLTMTNGKTAVLEFAYELDPEQAEPVELFVPTGLFDGKVNIDNPEVASGAPRLFINDTMIFAGTKNGTDIYRVEVNQAAIAEYLNSFAADENEENAGAPENGGTEDEDTEGDGAEGESVLTGTAKPSITTSFELSVRALVSADFEPSETLNLSVGGKIVVFEVAASKAGEPKAPVSMTPMSGSADVTGLLEEVKSWVTQDGQEIYEDQNIDSKKDFTINVVFRIPVVTEGLPNGSYVNSGDYAVFQMPAGIVFKDTVQVPMNFVDTDGTSFNIGAVTFDNGALGGAVATVNFNGANAEKIFTDFISVYGSFEVTLKYNGANGSSGSDTVSITILDKEYQLLLPPPTPEKAAVTLKKSGAINYNTGEIEWTIEVIGNNDGVLNGYVLTDDLLDSTAQQDVGTYVDGSFISDSKAGGSGSFNNEKLTYTFPSAASDVPAGSYTFKFKTKLSDNILFAASASTNIKNTAVLTPRPESGAPVLTASSTLQYKPGWIAKNGEIYGNWAVPSERVIIWTVTGNPNSVDFGSGVNVTVTDTIPAGLTLDQTTNASTIKFGDSIYDLFGADTSWRSAHGITGVSVNSDGSGNTVLAIAFNHLKEKFDIRLRTTDNTNSIYLNQYVSYTNKVKIEKDNVIIGTAEKKLEPWIGVFSKNGKWEDESRGIIKWTVSSNARSQAAGKSGVIYDAIIPGSVIPDYNSFDPASQAAVVGGAAVWNRITSHNDGKYLPSLNQKLVSGTLPSSGANFTAASMELTDGGGNVLAYLIIVNVTDVTAPVSITFQTQVTDPALLLNAGASVFHNQAWLKVDADKWGGVLGKVAREKIFLKKEALERGANENALYYAAIADGKDNIFDYDEKTAIFRLTLNSSKLDLTAAGDAKGIPETKITLSDTLPGGWEPAAFANGSRYFVYDESGVAVADLLSSREPVGGASYVFEIADISKLDNKTYYVYIKARFTGAEEFFTKNQSDIFSNRASVKFTAWNKELTDTQDVFVESVVFDKNSKILPDDVRIKWTVTYNPYQMGAIGHYIRDKLPEGLELEADTVKAYPITLGGDGSYFVGAVPISGSDYIAYDDVTRQLRFDFPDTGVGYQLEYITVITAGAKTKLKNKAELMYEETTIIEVDDTYMVTYANASAVARLTGWFELTKIDGFTGNVIAGGEQGKPAQFTLWSADKTQRVRTGWTDENGKLMMRALTEGSYVLEETIPPSGYEMTWKEYAVSVTKANAEAMNTAINGMSQSGANKFAVENFKDDEIGQLKLSKQITGNRADLTQKFEFTISFYETNAQGDLELTSKPLIYKDHELNKGEIVGTKTFKLSDDQYIIVGNIPLGMTYEISELYGKDDYTTTVVSYVETSPRDVTVTTDRNSAGAIVLGTTLVEYINRNHHSTGGGGTEPPDTPKNPEDSEEPGDTDDPGDPRDPIDAGGDNGGDPPGISSEEIPNTPTPTSPGNSLISNEDGTYTEFDEDGIPLGIWEQGEDGEWVFIPEDIPLGLPDTGSIMILIGLLAAAILCVAGIVIGCKSKEE